MRAASLFLFAAACGGSSASNAPAPGTGTRAWKPQHGQALSIARRTTENLAHDPNGPRPDWVLYDPKGDQIVFVAGSGGDAGTERALAIAQSYDVDRAAAGAGTTSSTFTSSSSTTLSFGHASFDPSTDPTTAAVIAGIQQVDDEHYVVDRAAVDKLLTDPMSLARSARVVPAVQNGAPSGYKVYAIRPGSVLAAVGLQNGDTIHEVNGQELTPPDKALEVYTQMQGATSIELSIIRHGQELVLHYSIK